MLTASPFVPPSLADDAFSRVSRDSAGFLTRGVSEGERSTLCSARQP
jgi:hypothetical protein